MSFDLKTALGSIAPTLAMMLGGPLAGTAVSGLLAAFGIDSTGDQGKDVAAITKVVQGGAMTPDIIAAVRKADQDHAEKMGQQGIDLQRIAADHDKAILQGQVDALTAVNKTMQAEATSDHWPTYSWRPFIGFMFGGYVASMWLLPLAGVTPVVLSSDLTLAVGGILGVASFFRGKMQADPAVPSDNRG